jgi:glycosyltransferase involved in cell wall biosynthesis
MNSCAEFSGATSGSRYSPHFTGVARQHVAVPSGNDGNPFMPLILRYGRQAPARPVLAEAALIVSTYQRPRHLQLSLTSIALQACASGTFELVVTDDGSQDETFAVVERFAATVDFPVTLTTHPHDTFQVAQCRNEGVAASTAPYLIFTDGDLILPPDFIDQHLRRRRANMAFSGECYRLAEDVSAGLDEDAVRRGDYRNLVSPGELARVRKADWRARWHALLRHRDRPRLIGWNVGLWRSDYERVNGYDEQFRGWGCEDDDLTQRLRGIRVRTRWINRWTCGYHVWHPRDASAPAVWHDAANVAYYQRAGRPNRCVDGLVKFAGASEPSAGEAPKSDRADGIALRGTQIDQSSQRRNAA